MSGLEEERMKIRVERINNGKQNTGLAKGSMYFVGSRMYYLSSGGVLSFFSLETGEWFALPIFAMSLVGPDHAGALVDDKIYITGSTGLTGANGVYEVDLVLRTIDTVQTFGGTVGPTDREAMTAVYANWRREIVYFGGYVEVIGDLFDVELELELELKNETYCFDVDAKSWQLLQMKGRLPTARTGHAALLRGYNMYVYGGYNETVGYFRDIWIAHLGTHVRPYWTKPEVGGRIPPGRVRATFNILDGYLVTFGGDSRQEEVSTRIDLYCPRSRQWWVGESADQVLRNPKNSIEIIGVHPKPRGHPLGIAVSDGVLILTYSHLHKITIEHAP